jgi:hypothetical protein
MLLPSAAAPADRSITARTGDEQAGATATEEPEYDPVAGCQPAFLESTARSRPGARTARRRGWSIQRSEADRTAERSRRACPDFLRPLPAQHVRSNVRQPRKTSRRVRTDASGVCDRLLRVQRAFARPDFQGTRRFHQHRENSSATRLSKVRSSVAGGIDATDRATPPTSHLREPANDAAVEQGQRAAEVDSAVWRSHPSSCRRGSASASA